MIEDKVLCRCEEVLESEIREAIQAGARTLHGVKIRTRAGMGLCQGQTCQRLIARILAEETGQSPAEILPATYRPPCRPINLSFLSGVEG